MKKNFNVFFTLIMLGLATFQNEVLVFFSSVQPQMKSE